MKVCLIQPAYSTDYALSDKYFADELKLLSECDESMDVIVLPESCDIPCLAPTKEAAEASCAKYGPMLLEAAAETAKRCGAMVFLNARDRVGGRLRNTTYAFDRSGNIVGKYYKQHLTPGEVKTLDSDYSFEFSEPTVIELEGLRIGFLTCYDFYFYEGFDVLAHQGLDLIIGCSHQRTDTHEALLLMTRFLSYNTNAYVLRSSVSMGEDSPLGGTSMIAAPDGSVLLDMESRVGLATAEIDPAKKYYKPAGFGNPPAAHYEYREQGRRPWKYRPAGSAIVPPDDIMPYPRVCAHRGFNTVAPENSLPAYGAAVAMGAEEIEFDLWETADGEVVSMHDPTLERVSDGSGKIWEHTLAELLQLDFGSRFNPEFAGLRIPTFEDILAKFACHCVMNIHIKTQGSPGFLKKIVDAIKKYNCEKYVYFMSGDDALLEKLKRDYPEFPRCCGYGNGGDHVERAIRFDCSKIQFFMTYFDAEMVKKAHEHGMLCTVCGPDSPEDVEKYLDMGIDVILTNHYNRTAQIVAKREKYPAPSLR